MKLSPNFTLAEFTASATAKARGLRNDPTPQHLANMMRTAAGMEKVRAILGNKPITVTSAYRNPAVNKAVGGVSNSDHALGWAVDFKCPAFGNPLAICLAIADSKLVYDQLIHERKPDGSWWVHISFNPRTRQQDLTYNGTAYKPGIHAVVFK